MAKEISFQLDTVGGEEIITRMAMPYVKKSAEAIANRANSMAGGMTSDPPTFNVSTKFGTIRRGTRAIATISSEGGTARKNYVAHTVLPKSKDAGRV